MIQETLRSLIETKLNNNTKGKKFVVGSYAYLEDRDEHFIYNVRSSYKTIEKNFIPVNMSFSASYQAIPTQINGSAKISLTFLILADKQVDLDTDLATLDEFVPKIVGNFETLEDDTYNSVWNMDAFVPLGLTERPINGNYYLQVQTNVYVDYSDSNYYGNQYQYFLNGSRIYPYEPNIQRQNEEDTPHLLGDLESKGGMKTSNWSATWVFYVNNAISSVIDRFSSSTYDMNDIYQFREITPTRTTALNIPVRIQSAVYNPILGEKVFASITFVKADDSYVAPVERTKRWASSNFDYWTAQDVSLKATSESTGTGQPTELPSSYELGFAMRKEIAQVGEDIVYSFWQVVFE
jgi:hypothetical protein